MSLLSQSLSGVAGQWVLRPSVVSVGPGPAPAPVLAADSLRWGVMFTLLAGAGAEVTLAPDPQVSATHGFYLAGPGNLDFEIRKWGGLVTAAWYGSADVVHPVSLYIMEVLVQQ